MAAAAFGAAFAVSARDAGGRADLPPAGSEPPAMQADSSAKAARTVQAVDSARGDSSSLKAEPAAARGAEADSAVAGSASARADSASGRTQVDGIGRTEGAEESSAESSEESSAESSAESGEVEEHRSPGEFADIGPAPAPRRAVSPAVFGKPGRLDGIAAVVGSEIILYSELEAYAYMRLAATGADPGDVDLGGLLRESRDDLIDNKVLLVRAMEDSAIHVRSDEVESTLNNHINMILRQNGITTEQLDAQLRAQQGTTLARFKAEARGAIREQLLKQKLQQSYYFSARVSRRDVERFFAEYADSLPVIGESFELFRLSLRLASSDSARQAALDRIRSVKQRLDAGGSFEELAKQFSESPEGPSGGDLGYLVKGSTTELAFEEQAFSLPVGRVSEPFETRLGFHVLVVEEKRDLRVKLRQILVRHAPTEQQREALIARLDSLRQSVRSREEFEAAARAMSADQATRARGGGLGWMSLLEMPPAMRGAVQNLEAGQISAPVAEDNMLSIYMVNGRVDSRRLTLENDYAAIAEKARDIIAQKQLLDSVRRWRERVFIDIRE
jgi:peptidyl-prolyl cis-trans isomerase SurA